MGLSVSPDGQWVVFSLNELVARDLTLVENFHVD